MRVRVAIDGGRRLVGWLPSGPSPFSSTFNLTPLGMMAYLAIGLAVVAWQCIPRRATTKTLFVGPTVLAFMSLRGWQDPSAVPWAAFLVELVVAIGLGLARGGTVRVWRGPDGAWWRRATGLTLAIWVVSAASRVASGLLLGQSLNGSTGAEFALLFAASTLAESFVVWLRTDLSEAFLHPDRVVPPTSRTEESQ